MDESDEERFWDKVEKGGPDECWEWQASTVTQGYGQFWYDGSNGMAHRVVMEIVEGSEPDDHVLHHCDNKVCVNPAHLYVGTNSDNMEDAWERNDVMNRIGENHHLAKLSRDEAEEIIDRLDEGEQSQYEIAEEFGVTQPLISKIANKERWRQLHE